MTAVVIALTFVAFLCLKFLHLELNFSDRMIIPRGSWLALCSTRETIDRTFYVCCSSKVHEGSNTTIRYQRVSQPLSHSVPLSVDRCSEHRVGRHFQVEVAGEGADATRIASAMSTAT